MGIGKVMVEGLKVIFLLSKRRRQNIREKVR